MDSKTLYIASNKYQRKISWINFSTNEWQYCGAGDEVKWDVVTDSIDDFFEEPGLMVVVGRNDSFETQKADVMDAIKLLVGNKNFFVWSEDFQKVVEFNHIGVFRKGIFAEHVKAEGSGISYNKIRSGSPDKVKGILVKYKKGDCLSIDCANGMYLAVLVSEKFNNYYDLTLLEYLQERKPGPEDFLNGRVFGNYGDASTLGYIPIGTERLMLPCLKIDADPAVEMVCSLMLKKSVEISSYGYREDIGEILKHYLQDLPKRLQNTRVFDEISNHLFISNRLIPVKQLIIA